MRVYYLDWPLETKELEQVCVAVAGSATAAELQQVRIPCVLPTANGPDGNGPAAESLLRLALSYLRRAGLDRDTGRQVAWVLPRNALWSEAFQEAIYRLTGYSPIAIQRWRAQDDGTPQRAPLAVMDLHGMRHTSAHALDGP